jgi:sugar O-acyltransferase (sialic acid O-acetyltransferase NeuD family)
MDVLIVGAGGHGRVVLDILRCSGLHRPIGFLDADPSRNGSTIHGLPVLGQVNLLPKLKLQKTRGAIVAIGDNRARASYADILRQEEFELVNAIHPSANVSKTASLGVNVVVAAGAVIGTDSEIGDCVIVNTSAVIDHECKIEPAAHICPAAALAGRVHVGEMAFIGLGSRIIQCLSIGRQATVGAGAVVIGDVPDLATAVGVPARVIKLDHPSPAPAETCEV